MCVRIAQRTQRHRDTEKKEEKCREAREVQFANIDNSFWLIIKKKCHP